MNDYEVIIAWNSNPDFMSIVEETFGASIILKKQITLSFQDRCNKINELYHPIIVPTNSSRCTDNRPLTIYVITLPAHYEYVYRTEGYRLCNKNILNFKIETRKTFDYTVFHCSDNIDETKRALKVFNLELDMPKKSIFDTEFFEPTCDIVPVEKLYHIRHISDGSYQMIAIKDSVTVLNLIGYDNNYLIKTYNLLHRDDESAIVNVKTLDYFSNLPDFRQSHNDCRIDAYKCGDKYIITDGKHRSALLYFRGDRHIFVNYSQRPCADHIICSSIQMTPLENTHLENLNKFIYALNNNNIRFVVIRGHATMPKTADTDLDIVIHPEDYNKFLTVISEHLNNGTLKFNVEKKYNHSDQSLMYRAYRTSGIHNEFLTNQAYQLDTYNNIFFFLSDTDGVTLSKYFLDYLFNNRKLKYNLYIPDELSELVLLFCRTWIDLGGNWKLKHKTRFNELIKNVSLDEFKKLLSSALPAHMRHLLNNFS